MPDEARGCLLEPRGFSRTTDRPRLNQPDAIKIFRHATIFHSIRTTMYDYTDDTRYVRHLSRSRLSLLSRRKSSFSFSSFDRRSHSIVSSFPISFRSITDPHDPPRAHGASSARDRLPKHVPRVAIDERKSSHTVHCERSPFCRFRAMTWRTDVRRINRGLGWSFGRSTRRAIRKSSSVPRRQ